MNERDTQYRDVLERIRAILDGEDDWIAAMATVACELHHQFEHFDWTGFYRRTGPTTLTIGPYQGTHGCLRIDFARGVCGAAARTRTTQLVDDVSSFDGHIACSTTTRSELVVPLVASDGELVAVLDVDSNTPAAFDEADRRHLEELAEWLAQTFHA